MKSTPKVVFVCEHGSAKSVIAATHLNRLAHERRIPIQAVGRGLDPDAAFPPHAINGLSSEGLAPNSSKPERLSSGDLEDAIRIVTFCGIPAMYSERVPTDLWMDVPPVSQDYGQARDAITRHVSALLDSLSPRHENRE